MRWCGRHGSGKKRSGRGEGRRGSPGGEEEEGEGEFSRTMTGPLRHTDHLEYNM